MNTQNNLKRLVLVDDEEMVIKSIKNFLMLETDYEVLSFTSPLKAIEALKTTPVNLAISDFLMPELDGIDFLKTVKNLYPQATLMLLTGYADKENAIKAINDIGIYKYIEKPWDNEDLKISIENAFERTDLILNLEQKINELKKAQDKLKQYNEKLEQLVAERTEEIQYINAELEATIESSPDGILTLNNNLLITSANPAFLQLCNLQTKDITNKSLLDIITFNKIKDLKPENITKPLIDTNCYIQNSIKGTYIPIELSIAPIKNTHHKVGHRFVAISRDITAQKETERLRSDFIATLTHDLRTPLQAAIQTLDFFLDRTLGDLNDKQDKYLDTMRTSNKDMLGLVNGLLEVYKLESEGSRLTKDHFNLIDLIKQCTNEIKSLLDKKSLELNVKIPDNTVEIYGDKKELKRVLANFLGNAINFTPPKGQITVETCIKNDEIHVSVADTGRGIPDSDLGKLFQRFSQGTSKQRSTGTGLGLYLSRQIVEGHNGKIWVKSKENAGSTFGFSIPLRIVEE